MLWTAAGRFPPRTTDTAPRTPADARGATPKRPPGPPQPVGFRVPGRLRCVWGFVDSGICTSLQKKPTDPRPPPCHPSKTAAGPHASSVRRNCSPEVSSDHHLECSRYVHAEDTASSTRSSRSDSCATSRAPRPPPPGTMLWTAAGRFPPRTTDTAPRTPADARGATPKRPPGPPQPVGFRVPGRLRCVWGFVDSGICASLQKKPTDPRPPPCHPSKTAAGPHASSVRRNCSPEVSSDHHLECSRYVRYPSTSARWQLPFAA